MESIRQALESRWLARVGGHNSAWQELATTDGAN